MDSASLRKIREDVDAAKLILLRQHLLQSTEKNILFYVVTFYQRDFSRGLASFTFYARPSISFPFSASTADFPSVESYISTKPKPLDRLLTLSIITEALLTLPN